MNNRLMTRLAALPANKMRFVAIGMPVVLAALLAALVASALLSLQAMRAEIARLETQAADRQLLEQVGAQLADETKRLRQRPDESAGGGTPDQLAARAMGEFSRLSGQHKTVLANVMPGAASKVLMFDAAAFDVELRGRYANVFAWLQGVEAALPTAALSRLEIVPHESGDELVVRVHIVIYQETEHGK